MAARRVHPGRHSRRVEQVAAVVLDNVRPPQPIQFALHARQALLTVENQKALSGKKAQDRVAVVVVVDGDVGWVVAVARGQGFEDDLGLADSGNGVGEIGVGQIVELVFGEQVGLAQVGQVDVGQVDVAQIAQGREAGVAFGVRHEVAGGDGVDAVDDGSGANPVHDFVFVAQAGVGVGAGLGDDESRGKAASHRFGDAQDMVAAGLGVARSTVVVGDAVAADVEFVEFGAVSIPLEDDGLGPVMPDGSADDDVLVDQDRGVRDGPASHSFGIQSNYTFVFVKIDGAVLTGEFDVGGFVVGFVNGEAARIGVVAAEGAAG